MCGGKIVAPRHAALASRQAGPHCDPSVATHFHPPFSDLFVRVVMSVFLVALLVGLAVDSASRDPAATDPVASGLQALYASGATDAHVLEAVLAAGEDPRAWHGTDLLGAARVPAPNLDPIEGLYELAVVLSADTDARAWQDPVRGEVDLVQQVLGNLDAALASKNDAVHSFQLLAMVHAGLGDHDAVPPLRGALLALQHDDGSWGCGPWVGPECTSYALRALAASGGIPLDVRAAAVAYIESRLEGHAYSDPLNGVDVQITANAIRGLLAADAPVPEYVIVALVAEQHDGLWHKAGRPSLWATAEVLVALSEAGAR